MEDNEDDSSLFRLALEKLGYTGQYDWVRSTEAALARLTAGEIPTLIVADGFRAAGLQSLHRLWQASGRYGIPIVVSSGEADEHAMDEALRNGASAYLLKETTFEDSIVAVQRILAEFGDRAL